MLRILLFVISCLSQSAIAQPVSDLFHVDDDCQFIRDAIANPNSLEFTIPSGTYICKSAIVINRDFFKLSGTTKESTILKLADNANSPMIVIGNIETPPNPVTGVKVTNLTVDGNMNGQQMECWGGPCDAGGIALIRNNAITIRGARGLTGEGLVYSDNANKAAPNYQTRGAEVLNVLLKGARSGGLVTEKGCTNLWVDRMEATENFFDGFAGYQTKDSLFSNLHLHNNVHGAGISIDIFFNKNTFSKTRIENNKDVGIFMRESVKNTFIDLSLSGNGNHGVFMARAQVEKPESCASRNKFINLKFVRSPIPNDKSDVFLADDCSGNLVRGAEVSYSTGSSFLPTPILKTFENKAGQLKVK